MKEKPNRAKAIKEIEKVLKKYDCAAMYVISDNGILGRASYLPASWNYIKVADDDASRFVLDVPDAEKLRESAAMFAAFEQCLRGSADDCRDFLMTLGQGPVPLGVIQVRRIDEQ
jgi:hypothetical protein